MSAIQIIHEFCQQNHMVERYLLGELKGLDLDDFERHMFECCICFDEVKLGQEFKQHLAAGVTAPRKSRMQRIKEFWAKHFSNPEGGQR